MKKILAIEWDDGTKAWYENGRLHRLNGPAYVTDTGTKEYWINGVELTEEEWKERIMKITPIQMTKDTFNSMFGRFSDDCEKYVSVYLLLEFIESHDIEDPDFKEDLFKFIIRTSKCYKGRSV